MFSKDSWIKIFPLGLKYFIRQNIFMFTTACRVFSPAENLPRLFTRSKLPAVNPPLVLLHLKIFFTAVIARGKVEVCPRLEGSILPVGTVGVPCFPALANKLSVLFKGTCAIGKYHLQSLKSHHNSSSHNKAMSAKLDQQTQSRMKILFNTAFYVASKGLAFKNFPGLLDL